MKMSELNIGMKLEDSRTDEVFTVVEKNSKYKTVMLEDANGRTRSTTIATITKHFTEVVDLDDLGTPEEPVEVEAEPVVEEPVVEEPVVEEPESEEVEDEEKPKKTKPVKTKRVPYVPEPEVLAVLEWLKDHELPAV